MGVEIKTAGKLDAGVPKVLFNTQLLFTPRGYPYASTADGKRFLVIETEDSRAPAQLMVVVNWLEAIKKN